MGSLRSTRKPLGFERLESRDLMAGNVTVAVTRGVLEVLGDDKANSITVAFNAATNKYEVHGHATAGGVTKINGFDTALPGNVPQFANAASVRIRLNGGDDSLQFGTAANPNVTINGYLNIQMGNGHDTVVAGQAGTSAGGVDPLAKAVDVSSTVAIFTEAGNDLIQMANFHTDRNLTINTGVGDDRLQCFTSFVPSGGSTATNFPVRADGNFAVQMGAGNDHVNVANLVVGGDLRIRDVGGLASISLKHSYAARQAEVTTGGLSDEVLIDTLTSKFLTVNAGGGNDDVTIRRAGVRRMNVRLEAGSDKLRLAENDVSQYTLLDGGKDTDVLVGEGGNQLRGKISRSFG